MSKDADRLEVRNARDAEIVLENPEFSKAFATVKSQIAKQWEACDLRDTQGQLIYLQLSKIATMYEGILRGTVEAGKLAQKRIDIDAARNESRPRQFMRRVVNG